MCLAQVDALAAELDDISATSVLGCVLPSTGQSAVTRSLSGTLGRHGDRGGSASWGTSRVRQLVLGRAAWER